MKPGVAFGDFITTEKIPRRRAQRLGDRDDLVSMRGIFCVVLFTLAVIILTGRLLYLQIVHGSYYRTLSDSNRIRTYTIHAPRGVIFDRNNRPLVYNIPGFRTIGDGRIKLLGRETALKLIARGDTSIGIDSLRSYPQKESSAHVLGYIGQISQEELGDKKFSSYLPGDLIGKMGLEREYEQELRGVDGKRLVEINSSGGIERTLGQNDPVPGNNIAVTLDTRLQEKAYEAIQDIKKGAVIVSTPRGEILSLVSKPSFDPNLFTLDETYAASASSQYFAITDVLNDTENQPLLNRAIAGAYPPGSTFKLITAAAGLEGRVIDEKYQVQDTGVLTVGAFSFANWYYTQYGKTESEVDVVKAIRRSNDIFFYKLAEIVGVDSLSEMAKKFGLGSPLGIDLGGEVSGTVPNPSWKKNVIGESWYLGDTYHYGIGQGYLLTTPLQVNIWTQAIANGGVLYKQHLLKSDKQQAIRDKFLGGKTVSLIRQGMIESCSPGGVAWPLFEFRIKNKELRIDSKNFFEVPESTTSGSLKDYRKVSVACKTGTAQHGGEKTLPHAWITLFAPAYDPQIIVTVLAESSGEGSNIAAPIAKKILEEWFSR